jgi:hypothetical protein
MATALHVKKSIKNKRMKNKIITSIISFCLITSAYACEICGCGTGDYYIGLLPQFNKHFIGLRYQYSSFKTTMQEDASEYSNDRFQSVEVWGGWNIGRKWQVLAIVPFNFIHQQSDDGTSNNSGIGDIAVMGNYKLLDKASTTVSKKLIKQKLWIGAGIKMATGKFLVDAGDEAPVSLANTQTGSGSTDFILNGSYNFSINNFGINTSCRYKINTANNNQFYFGNKFSAGSFGYYSFKKKNNFVVTPNAGLLYDNTSASKLGKEKIAMTGGYLLSTAAGLEVNVKKVTIGLNVQLPVSQNFSDNQTSTRLKGMMHVTFGF